MDYPHDIEYSTITGKLGFLIPSQSQNNMDLEEFIKSLTITINANPDLLVYDDGQDSMILYNKPIKCKIDTDGYLLDQDGTRGIKVIASDSQHVRPSGFTYTVNIQLPNEFGSHPINVLAKKNQEVAFAASLDTPLTYGTDPRIVDIQARLDAPLAGKTVYFAGDSRMIAVTDSMTLADRFKELTGANGVNIAKNDATTAIWTHSDSAYAEITTMDLRNADAIVIAGSINDAAYGVPLGEHTAPGSDHDVRTYLGAVEAIIEYVTKQNPACRILWVKNNNIKVPDSLSVEEAQNVVALIRKYESELDKVKQDYGFEYVDFSVPQLNGNLENVRFANYMNNDDPAIPGFSGDGIHPNANGHRIMAEIVARALM